MNFKSTLTIAAIAVSGIIFTGCSGKNTKEDSKKMHKKEHHKAHWSYSGKTGPAHWGDLSKDYHTCKAGKAQSPIDIRKTVKDNMPVLKFDYKATVLNVKNNGHTLQLDYKPGSTLTVGDAKFNLLQLHFHTPSEHKRHGRFRPMEVHFVHANAKGQLAVVGVFMRIGKQPNALFAQILKNAPAKVGKNVVKGKMVNAKGLHSRRMKAYFNYSGSLTTPPCSEGVRWFVMKNSVRVSAKQVAAFKKIFNNTNRPVQSLNGRKVSINN